MIKNKKRDFIVCRHSVKIRCVKIVNGITRSCVASKGVYKHQIFNDDRRLDRMIVRLTNIVIDRVASLLKIAKLTLGLDKMKKVLDYLYIAAVERILIHTCKIGLLINFFCT